MLSDNWGGGVFVSWELRKGALDSELNLPSDAIIQELHNLQKQPLPASVSNLEMTAVVIVTALQAHDKG